MVIVSLLLVIPIFLFVMALNLILPFILGVALTSVVSFLLGCNLLFFLVLLLVWIMWKKSGKMAREYFDTLDGWKRRALPVARVLLIVVMIWEAIIMAVFTALLIFRPWNAMLP